MSPSVQPLMEGEVRVRHRLAYPAVPEQVARSSRAARRAMRTPLLMTAGLTLVALTAALAGLVLLRPGAAAVALLLAGGAQLIRTRTRRSYDSITGWSWRLGIAGGVLGELGTRLLAPAGATPVPSSLVLAADALGVGGAIGLGVALATSSAVVVMTFLYATATFGRVRELPS